MWACSRVSCLKFYSLSHASSSLLSRPTPDKRAHCRSGLADNRLGIRGRGDGAERGPIDRLAGPSVRIREACEALRSGSARRGRLLVAVAPSAILLLGM